MERWYVEVWKSGYWHRLVGKWVFEAAVVKARETAINGQTWTKLVRA